jgi:hypothetical protein
MERGRGRAREREREGKKSAARPETPPLLRAQLRDLAIMNGTYKESTKTFGVSPALRSSQPAAPAYGSQPTAPAYGYAPHPAPHGFGAPQHGYAGGGYVGYPQAPAVSGYPQAPAASVRALHRPQTPRPLPPRRTGEGRGMSS